MKSLVSLLLLFLLGSSTYSCIAFNFGDDEHRYLHEDDEHRHLLGEVTPPVSISRTKDCPAGYNLNGKHCERINIVSSSFVCPPGTSSVDGQCLTFNSVSKVCSPGSHLVGDVCVSSQSSPASFECRVGEPDGSGRGCQTFTEVPPVCPNGFRMDPTGSCVRFSQQSLVCPPGHSLQHKGTCVQSISTPASPVCDEDMNLDGHKTCTKLIHVPSRCPNGFQMNGKSCVKSLPLVPAPCPSGYRLSGNQCVRSLEFPPLPVCPNSHSLNGNVCLQEIPVPPTCPAGSTRGSSGDCEQSVSQVPICQDGTTMVHESAGRIRTQQSAPSCKQSFMSEPIPNCTAGFRLIHGKCKKVITHPSSIRCTQGVLQGGACTVHSSQTPFYECPADYRLSKGPKCIRDVAFDCSTTITTKQCDFPSFVSELMSNNQPQYNVESAVVSSMGSKHRVLKGVPKVAVMEGKEPVCRDVSQVVPRTCTKNEATPASLVCPDGSQPVGKTCPSTQSLAAEVFCSVGLLDQSTGKCVEIKVQPAHHVCPSGSQREGKHCVQHQIEPASMVCPDNAQMSGKDGRCVIRIQEINHPNQISRQAPQLICERGRLVHTKCIDSESVPQAFVCPHGTDDMGGKCITTAAVISPPPITVTKPASHRCPDGRPAVGKSCLSTSSIPADRVCNDGGVLHNDKCLHQVTSIQSAPRVSRTPAVPVCPMGLSLQGEQCIQRIQEPAALTCPPNYQLSQDGRKCTASHPLSEVCPPGTQKGSEGCYNKSRVPSRVTEVKQCTKGQPGC